MVVVIKGPQTLVECGISSKQLFLGEMLHYTELEVDSNVFCLFSESSPNFSEIFKRL